ncbi:hypothetical protein RM543_05500 [Roseicyclus sp. F158]|uniref:Lipoprotein n=1 Tax=Tropicimonas omnivorans TaxID=3075590 RepID=A0ABU3DEJ0_9RHOB|nr:MULTISPECIES: hypothetical protein [Roseobacteraceae]MDT0682130.1 hypothetical protein [Roseicyclus sp. F158]
MSTSIKVIFALGLVAFAAACAQEEEVVFVEEPIVAEPVYSKY